MAAFMKKVSEKLLYLFKVTQLLVAEKPFKLRSASLQSPALTTVPNFLPGHTASVVRKSWALVLLDFQAWSAPESRRRELLHVQHRAPSLALKGHSMDRRCSNKMYR